MDTSTTSPKGALTPEQSALNLFEVVTGTKAFNAFYPASNSVRLAARGESLGSIALEQRLRVHLAGAVMGVGNMERKLIRRICQIRREVEYLKDLDPAVKQVVKEAVAWLRAVGREVDFQADNPANWVTQRGGEPRW